MRELARKHIFITVLAAMGIGMMITLYFSKSYANDVGDEMKNYTDQKIDTVVMNVNKQFEYMIIQDSITRTVICSKIDTIGTKINKIHGRGN